MSGNAGNEKKSLNVAKTFLCLAEVERLVDSLSWCAQLQIFTYYSSGWKIALICIVFCRFCGNSVSNLCHICMENCEDGSDVFVALRFPQLIGLFHNKHFNNICVSTEHWLTELWQWMHVCNISEGTGTVEGQVQSQYSTVLLYCITVQYYNQLIHDHNQ